MEPADPSRRRAGRHAGRAAANRGSTLAGEVGKRLADLTGGVVARRPPDPTWWVASGVVVWQRRS